MRRVDHHNGAILLGSVLLLLSVAGLVTAPHIALPSSSLAARLFSGIGWDGGAGRTSYAAPTPPAASPTPAATPTSTPFLPELPTLAPAAAVAADDLPIVTVIPDAEDLINGAAGDASFLVPHSPEETPIPPAPPLTPERIAIPAVSLEAAVLPASYQLVSYDGQVFQQWDAPAQYAAGWQSSSAMLGVPGNTVLNGHHNVYGSVFGRLAELNEGDVIQLYSGGERIDYTVSNKMILQEEGMPLGVRLENARWLSSSQDERLTLVTCWPQNSNSHRLIIVARPVGRVSGGG